MVGQSKRRGSTIPVSVDRRWDWLLGQVTFILDGITTVLKVASEPIFCGGDVRRNDPHHHMVLD